MRHHSFAKLFLVSGLFAATVIAALLAYGLTHTPAQIPASAPPPAAVEAATTTPVGPFVYANDTYGFTLAYPDSATATTDAAEMTASGYIPVCDPDHAVACFIYGLPKYAGTNFGNAAFAVHIRKDLKTKTACDSPQDDQDDGAATIGGTSFRKFAFSDAAMSHRLDGENYRVFRDDTCFELSTRVATTVYEVYAPGMVSRFTDLDRSAVQHVLDTMLMSFRFGR